MALTSDARPWYPCPVRTSSVACLLLLLVAPASAQETRDSARALDAPTASASGSSEVAPQRFTLANGLRVILQPVPDRAFVGVGVTYDVGASDVPPGWTGLAHLTEHLMFSGTDTIGEVEIYLRLEAAGAVVRNALTSQDRTSYYEVLPAGQMEWAFWLESQRMARLLAGLDEARVARQRAVVLHEGWERNLYGWRGVLQQRRYSGVFPAGHPYTNFMERERDVHAIRLPHVQWFFQRWYTPDNATLVVVGGFDPARVRASIERYFGPIRRSAPAFLRPAVPAVRPLPHERRIVVEIQNDRDQAEVSWPAPALFAAGDAELDVLSTLLTDRREAPLYAALRESGLALEIQARQYSHQHGSVFVLAAVPAHGHSVGQVLSAMDDAFERVRDNPFGEADVARVREQWARRMLVQAEDLGARLGLLSVGTDDYLPTIENERQRYLAVTPQSLAAVVDRWLPRDRRLILVGHANPRAPPQARILSDRIVPRVP